MEPMIREVLSIGGQIEIPVAELELSAVRSHGPGGQNVNKVATAAHLRFDAKNSAALPQPVKQRLLSMRDQRITSEGVVVIKARRYRSLERNKTAALERLRALIEAALVAPQPRKPTRPGKAAERRRLEQKARRAALKRSRGKAVEN